MPAPALVAVRDDLCPSAGTVSLLSHSTAIQSCASLKQPMIQTCT